MIGGATRSPAARALRWLAVAGVVALAAHAGRTLLREPCLGVADNRDWWRVARPAGIEVAPDLPKGFYVVCRHPAGEADPLGGLSSAGLVAWGVRAAADGPGGSVDLRWIGLVYWLATAALLTAGLLAGLDALLVLATAWVLYDPGFLLFFNSLYADPALIVALAAALILLLADPLRRSDDPRRGSRDAWAAAVLGGFSKMQYSTFPAVLLACCALAMAAARSRPRRRHGILLAALLAAAALAPVHFLHGPAPRFLDANNFNAVFGGIVRVATDPAAAVRALGMPEEEAARQPRDYFAARRRGVLAPVLPALRSLSRVRLAALYLGDPGAIARTAAEIHAQLGKVRTHPRGNYTREESGRGPRFHRSPEQFSLWRTRLLGAVPAWSHLLLAATALLLAWRAARRRWSALDAASLLLVLWSASQFAVAVLGEGLVNLDQHLLGARLAIDLLVALTAVRLIRSAARALVRHPGAGPAGSVPAPR